MGSIQWFLAELSPKMCLGYIYVTCSLTRRKTSTKERKSSYNTLNRFEHCLVTQILFTCFSSPWTTQEGKHCLCKKGISQQTNCLKCLVISLVVRVTVAFVFIPHSSAHTKFGYFTCCKGQSGISFYTTFFYTHNDYKLTETLSISCKIIIVSYGKIMLLQNCEQNQQYINVPFVLVP